MSDAFPFNDMMKCPYQQLEIPSIICFMQYFSGSVASLFLLDSAQSIENAKPKKPQTKQKPQTNRN